MHVCDTQVSLYTLRTMEYRSLERKLTKAKILVNANLQSWRQLTVYLSLQLAVIGTKRHLSVGKAMIRAGKPTGIKTH